MPVTFLPAVHDDSIVRGSRKGRESFRKNMPVQSSLNCETEGVTG